MSRNRSNAMKIVNNSLMRGGGRERIQNGSKQPLIAWGREGKSPGKRSKIHSCAGEGGTVSKVDKTAPHRGGGGGGGEGTYSKNNQKFTHVRGKVKPGQKWIKTAPHRVGEGRKISEKASKIHSCAGKVKPGQK